MCVQLKGEVEELKDALVERDGQLAQLQVRASELASYIRYSYNIRTAGRTQGEKLWRPRISEQYIIHDTLCNVKRSCHKKHL